MKFVFIAMLFIPEQSPEPTVSMAFQYSSFEECQAAELEFVQIAEANSIVWSTSRCQEVSNEM